MLTIPVFLILIAFISSLFMIDSMLSSTTYKSYNPFYSYVIIRKYGIKRLCIKDMTGVFCMLTMLFLVLSYVLQMLYYTEEYSIDSHTNSVVMPINTVKIYESDVFSSTILPILMDTIFTVDTRNTTDFIGIYDTAEKIITARDDEYGVLWVSPKERYNQLSGIYTVSFKAIIQDTTDDTPMQIRITNRHNDVLLDAFLSPQKTYHSYNYTLSEVDTMPFIELIKTGNGRVELSSIQIKAVSISDYEVLDTYDDVYDKSAKDLLARYSNPSEHVFGTMLFGPYDNKIADGEYIAAFRIRTSTPLYNENIARLEVASITQDTDKQRIESVIIPYNTPYKDYTYIEIPFSKQANEIVEYRVYTYDTAEIWIDHILLKKQISPNNTHNE